MNATNNQDRKDNRINKWVVGGIVLAIILLIMLLRSCSAGSNEYHMVLNGDNPFEIALNDQYTDPGVTFVDENDKPVSSKKQAELEKEMTITGLDQIDTAVSGEYPVTYQYEDQTLDRVVKVLAGNQTPGGSDNQDTNKPGTNDDETDKPGNNDDETNNNGNQTTDPVTGDPTKPVYKLPANVTFEDLIVVYDGNVHSITVQNLPQGIEAIYTNNTGVNAGRYDASVVLVLSDSMKGTYSSVEPASMTATLTIKQATPNYTIPTGLTAKVGQTLADVKLPKGFAFESSLTTSVGPVGYNAFLVSYTPEDTVNYKTVTHIEVLIKVIDPNGGGNNGGGDDDDDRRVVYNLPSNVTFSNRTVTYNGQTYTIWVANVPSGINVRYENNSGKDAGIYNSTAYFTVGDELKDKCYAVNPSSMSATLIINKAVPHYTVPTGLTAKVGQTLANVKLPKGFTFVDPLTTSVGTVGSHVFKVNFTPEDTKNYETVTGIDVIINVSDPGPGPGPGPDKPVYKLPGNTRFDDLIVTYDGTEYSITAVNIPNGIIASYSNATRSDAGTQTAKVVFSLSESLAAQYSGVEPNSMTAVLTINPATPSYTVPTGLTAVEGQTLADVRSQLGEGFSFEDPLTTSVGTPGNNDFTVTYRPSSSNYKTVTGIKVTIHVTRKPDPSKPKFTMPTNVAFNNLTETYTGTEYSITAVNVPDELSVAYRNNTRTNAGSQTAEAIFSLSDKGLENYSGIEGTTIMTATLTINPADPSYTVPTGLEAIEGQTLADVTLEEGFSFEDPLTTPVGAVGDNEFSVTYTPSSSNYKVVTGIKVTIHVKSAKTTLVLPSNVTLPDVEGIYGEQAVFETTVVNLPDHIVAVVYTNNTRSTAGIQTARVDFSIKPEWQDRYVDVSPSYLEATINIHKAVPSYTKPTGLTAKEGQTLGDVASQLGTGFEFEDDPSTSVGGEGDNNFTVKYTPGDTENYQVITGILVTIHVSEDVGIVDKSELEKAISDAEAINEADWTAESYSKFSSAYATAIGMPESTQQTVDEKTAAIRAALALLKKDDGSSDIKDPVDKTALIQATQVAEAIKETDWTPESYAAFLAAYATASSMPEETQDEVDAKTDAITAAIDLLKADSTDPDIKDPDTEEVNMDALMAIIEETDNVDPFAYTADSYAAYEEAFTKALDLPEDTQSEVDAKVSAIRAALNLLVPETNDPDLGGSDILDPSAISNADILQTVTEDESIEEETEESAEATEGENAEENDVTEENESTGEGEVIGEGEETQEGEDTENTNNVPESLPPASGEEAPPATNKREDAYVEEPVEYVEKGNDEEEPDAQGEETQEVAVEESHEDSNSGEGEDAQ